MSLDALRTSLQLKRPEHGKWGRTHKAVLEALADYANAAGEAFICVATICDDKWVERKSVLRAIADLREAGWIVDTGKRRGRTGQVIVWQLPWIEHRNKQSPNGDTYAEPADVDSRPALERQQPQGVQRVSVDCGTGGGGNSTQNGTVVQRVPKTDAKGAALSGKESPKRDTEPSTRLNPLPRVNPLAEGEGRASAPPPAREVKPKNGSAKSGKKGKRMVPENWTPDDKLVAWCDKEFPGIDWGGEAAKFRDWSRANDERFKNFDAAFRNWMRNAQRFALRDGKPSTPPKLRYLE